MIILGIHDGHNSGATIVKNGKVLASVLEERLTRKKNETGFPKKSIISCLNICKINKQNINKVVYASNFMHDSKYLNNPLDWYKVGIKEQLEDSKKPKIYEKLIFAERKKERINKVEKLLGISKINISFLDHHLCHVAASYYCSNFPKDKKILAISSDGSGDNLSGTVYVCKNNELKRLASTHRNASLGKIYSRVTALLGFKPWEHEYKIMGMAPYADHKASRAIKKNVFDKLIKVDSKNLRFVLKTKLSMNYSFKYLAENLQGERIDNISGALQLFTEEMLKKLVLAAVKKTKITTVLLSGGVFMNVKANHIISKIKNIKNLFVMPSCGDESLSIGAALYFYYQTTENKNFSKSTLKDLYLGNSFSINDETSVLKKIKKNKKIKIINRNLNIKAADLLSRGKVIARCCGRSEWGARALGNRSILARGDNYNMVNQINHKIKNRDFWMPFAPIIQDKFKKKYLIDKKNFRNPSFMTMIYDSKEKFFNEIICGSHTKDKTIRAQVLKRSSNPELYDLFNKYYKKTKLGCMLNTSFNLHGYPLVETPKDAMYVFLNSEIDALLFNNYLIVKR
jgi:carbamoyltransferase